ncbi:MAG: hypothetical protein JXA10_01745 [Anaerolineae bacterium]|nr:hypothetical protein [Anaerolineae bacterium]
MNNSDNFLAVLELINDILLATIVIIAASILLNNLTRALRDRVTRTSSGVLVCVIVAYLADGFVALDPDYDYLETWFRLQWIGIAFVPAALVHLSDALLATTGRPSRGRRRNVVRISYTISLIITLLALFSDYVIHGPYFGSIPHMKAGPGFLIYIAYLLVVGTFATINVLRARRRCLTRYTHRRMTYLLIVFLTPAYGLFPYTLIGNLGNERQAGLMIVLNLANLIVMFMLVFMAYPLSFFGSEKPDRVVKTQFLEFMLRGPMTGAAVLAAIVSVPRASNVMGIDGDAVVPFVAVGIVMLLQWSITLLLPWLQRWLVYTQDQHRAQWIQQLGDRLLTQTDADQLLESTLAAICDLLRVSTAFVARLEPNGAQLVQVVGALAPSPEALTAPELSTLANGLHHTPTSQAETELGLKRSGNFFIWRSYWLAPLRYSQPAANGMAPPLLGVLGVWARAPEPDLQTEECEMLENLIEQAAHVLEGVQNQSEVFIILEGLASQMDFIQHMRDTSQFGHVAPRSAPTSDIVSDPEFSNLVKDALRDYWGGPKLTQSELLNLNAVWREMEEADDNNPVRALRTVLTQAIENLKPDGQRSLTTTEWILYNILEMRFLQRRKVRDVALRLAMSESDLYRKQRIAIEEVARQIEEMERSTTENNAKQPSPDNNSSSELNKS